MDMAGKKNATACNNRVSGLCRESYWDGGHTNHPLNAKCSWKNCQGFKGRIFIFKRKTNAVARMQGLDFSELSQSNPFEDRVILG